MGKQILSEPKLTACCALKTKKPMTAVQQPQQQHWLSRTPNEFLSQYIANQWHTNTNRSELQKVRYFSFTIRTFVFRGDRLFLANRNTNPNVMEELTVPTDRFDVTLLSAEDGQSRRYQVNQPRECSLSEHVKTVLSARYQHPNILQSARFMDEFSYEEPMVRRRIEATTYGEDELYLCDLEVSIVMSKFDGSLGNGPAFRWVTESEAVAIDDGLRFVSGLSILHVHEMYAIYRRCRRNQSFHEECTEQVRSALSARWKQGDINRMHRYGVLAQRDGSGGNGVWVFTMTSSDAAVRKETSAIHYEGSRHNVVGRFAVEAVQLKPEIEIWKSAIDVQGHVKVEWCDNTAKASFLSLLP